MRKPWQWNGSMDKYDPRYMMDSIIMLFLSAGMTVMLYDPSWFWKIFGIVGLINVPIECRMIYKRYKRMQELNRARDVRDQYASQ